MSKLFTTCSQYARRTRILKGIARAILVGLTVMFAMAAVAPVLADELPQAVTEHFPWGKAMAFALGTYLLARSLKTLQMPKPYSYFSLGFPPPPMPAPPMPEISPMKAEAAEGPLDEAGRTPLPTTESDMEAYFDNYSVNIFADEMKAKLKLCRENGRHGWWDGNNLTPDELDFALRLAMRKGDLVDIANHCMMLHQRGRTRLSK